MKSRIAKIALSAALLATGFGAYGTLERPTEYPVTFQESDFEAKPWLREFEWVVVVNRANTGIDKQSARVYHNQRLVQYDEIADYLTRLQAQQDATKEKDRNRKDRPERIAELARKQWAPGVFKISTGRGEFEAKGEHHAQKDSWSTTPTGFFVPQAFVARHKSESYSSGLCDSIFGKVAGAILRKQMCTYMENATFFNGGIALHKAIPGTEGALGVKASGGCVRMPAALAEFIFRNLAEARGVPVPQVNQDGSVMLDASGGLVREATHKSVWGKMEARNALIVVQDIP